MEVNGEVVKEVSRDVKVNGGVTKEAEKVKGVAEEILFVPGVLYRDCPTSASNMPEQANLLFLHTEKCARRADTNVERPNITMKDEVGGFSFCNYLEVTARLKKEKRDKEENKEGDNENCVTSVTIEDLVTLLDENIIIIACDESSWVVDSGAASHVTSRIDFFSSYTLGDFRTLTMGNETVSKVVGIDTIYLETSTESKLVLNNVKHAPEIRLRLISVGMVDNEGYVSTNDVESASSSTLWHKRLSHISEKGLNVLAKKRLLSNFESPKLEKCVQCLDRKQNRVSFKSHPPSRKTELLELVHSDLCGPMKTRTLGSALYFVTFIDDCLRKLWIYVLKSKDQVLGVFKQFQASVERETGKKLKCIRTDNSGEYCGPFEEYYERSKLDAKTRQCILIGYDLDKFGYRLYNLVEKKLVRSRDIVFMENQTIEDIDKMEKLESSSSDGVRYKKFESLIGEQGYKKTSSDHCVFVKSLSDDDFIIFFLYVNDMLIVENNASTIDELKKQLCKSFALKDLGHAKQILGIRITRIKDERKLYLSQEKYIEPVLERFNVKNAKVVNTSLASKEHWEVVKWILRYLRGTSADCLCFEGSDPILKGYTDADMAGDLVENLLLELYLHFQEELYHDSRSWKSVLHYLQLKLSILQLLKLIRISCYEFLQATDALSESNLIGSGSFGSVYKGILGSGTAIAVKVFNLQVDEAFKSFDMECEILRNLRHMNLRLSIMIDVACALEYLHHGCSSPVIHCDLKPSNVLLDEDMVAHLSDFGISKLLGEDESDLYTKTVATLGYIAPEYGRNGLVSKKCDVYSYGIMLLETFTRRKPNEFEGDLSLKQWVSYSLQEAVMDVVDANLLTSSGNRLQKELDVVASIMKVTIDCCVESPA
ncbi:putative CBL-interacting protein kinase 5-like isoform 1 [Capsicum annuum]|nr:putative CBL-interacting protein kinase 5-like isoform 1 [Capsicum annuum]